MLEFIENLLWHRIFCRLHFISSFSPIPLFSLSVFSSGSAPIPFLFCVLPYFCETRMLKRQNDEFYRACRLAFFSFPLSLCSADCRKLLRTKEKNAMKKGSTLRSKTKKERATSTNHSIYMIRCHV